MFKVSNRISRKRYEICSKLTMKTPEQHRLRSSVIIITFEYIAHLSLVFLFLSLER